MIKRSDPNKTSSYICPLLWGIQYMVNKLHFRGILMMVVFLPVLLIQVWNTSLVYLWYYGNKAAITQQFCVNKDKPQLKCDGKCHLHKVVDKTISLEDDWKNIATNSIEERTITMAQDDHEYLIFQLSAIKDKSNSFYYLYNYSLCYIKHLFRPPRLFWLNTLLLDLVLFST